MPLETRFWQKMVMLNYTHLYALPPFIQYSWRLTLRADEIRATPADFACRVLIHRCLRPHIGEFVRLYAETFLLI